MAPKKIGEPRHNNEEEGFVGEISSLDNESLRIFGINATVGDVFQDTKQRLWKLESVGAREDQSGWVDVVFSPIGNRNKELVLTTLQLKNNLKDGALKKQH